MTDQSNDLRFRGARSEQQEHLEIWEENSKQAAQHSKQEAQLGTCPLCGAAVKRRSDGYYECMSCQQAFSPERAATLPPFEAQPSAGLEAEARRYLDSHAWELSCKGTARIMAEFAREHSRPAATALDGLIQAISTREDKHGERFHADILHACSVGEKALKAEAALSGQATRPPEFTVGAAGSDLLGEDTGIPAASFERATSQDWMPAVEVILRWFMPKPCNYTRDATMMLVDILMKHAPQATPQDSITYHHRIEPRTGELLSDAPQSGLSPSISLIDQFYATTEYLRRSHNGAETCEDAACEGCAVVKKSASMIEAVTAQIAESGPFPSGERTPQDWMSHAAHEQYLAFNEWITKLLRFEAEVPSAESLHKTLVTILAKHAPESPVSPDRPPVCTCKDEDTYDDLTCPYHSQNLPLGQTRPTKRESPDRRMRELIDAVQPVLRQIEAHGPKQYSSFNGIFLRWAEMQAITKAVREAETSQQTAHADNRLKELINKAAQMIGRLRSYFLCRESLNPQDEVDIAGLLDELRESERGGKTIVVPKPPGFYIAWKPKGTIGSPHTFKTREAAEHFLSTFAPEVREKLQVVEAKGGTEGE